MNNPFFEEIHGRFGFGCMRLPMIGEQVDLKQFQTMVDAFMESGLNYFDTAHVYIEGQSETALRECLSSRYPRQSFILTNKLSGGCFETESDIRPLFQRQLDACGVEYFDFYLMHAQHAGNFPKYKACRAYETAFALKAEGKIRHVGISFHDKAEVLDKILTEYPEIEAVQIQFNYLDYNNPDVQSKGVYDVCVKHGRPVIVMEPVKGGSLANMNEEASGVLTALNNGSPASFAIRYAAGFEGMFMTLSGMSDVAQMKDNLSFMTDFKPLSEEESAAVNKVVDILNHLDIIPCTACRYCTEGCPMSINIPMLFKRKNELAQFPGQEQMIRKRLERGLTKSGKPSDCIECGQCEDICPQHLPIRDLLKKVDEVFA